MSIYLEVIVTSAGEAAAAQRGGADRLELVRDLDRGGLTPTLETVRDVLSAVSIPIRVMVREADCMQVESEAEELRLKQDIDRFASLPVNGLVLGYLRDGEVDSKTLEALLPVGFRGGVTFHRAFDEARHPIKAIETLKRCRHIDRILTRAAEGLPWEQRTAHLEEWQRCAGPEIQMLFAIGRDTSRLAELQKSPQHYEVHVGRAARMGHINSGPVSSAYVAALKGGPDSTSLVTSTPYKASEPVPR